MYWWKLWVHSEWAGWAGIDATHRGVSCSHCNLLDNRLSNRARGFYHTLPWIQWWIHSIATSSSRENPTRRRRVSLASPAVDSRFLRALNLSKSIFVTGAEGFFFVLFFCGIHGDSPLLRNEIYSFWVLKIIFFWAGSKKQSGKDKGRQVKQVISLSFFHKWNLKPT